MSVRFRHLRGIHDFPIGSGCGGHRLLRQAVEQLAPATKFPPVEAKRKLVQVVLQMPILHGVPPPRGDALQSGLDSSPASATLCPSEEFLSILSGLWPKTVTKEPLTWLFRDAPPCVQTNSQQRKAATVNRRLGSA